jgi:hypothetical protein
VGEGLTLAFAVNASDADGNTLTYSASGLPAGATFDPTSRVFNWTPSYSQAGDYSVSFRVSDGVFPIAASDTEVVAITVTERNPGDNLPPVLDAQTDRAGVVGQPMRFRITGHDPEGAALTYTGFGMPGGATIDASTGLFEWTPAEGQTNVFYVTFIGTDPGALADSESVYLVASEAGVSPPPPLACNSSQTVQEGIVDQGIDPISVAYSYQTITVLPNTQRLTGTLEWFGGPTRDLDFTLLDADSNVVGGSASTSNPEIIHVANPPAGTYYWRVTAFLNPDTCHYSITTDACVAEGTLAVDLDAAMRSIALAVSPNPARTVAALSFTLPTGGPARLQLFDISGRLVRTLQDGPLAAGRHVRVWDRHTDAGGIAANGVYFARIESSGKAVNRKVILLH